MFGNEESSRVIKNAENHYKQRHQEFGNLKNKAFSDNEDEGYWTDGDLIAQVGNAGPCWENWNETHNASHVTDISSGEIIDIEVTMAFKCPKCRRAVRVHANLTGKK
ncbi:Hypothetical predicted protein [Olea europaea subsp. europaea]|uniref:Uncharacterized protein n=1 Tax=Olea europaea subsp. europaea TaxID=158383 RepID=A0A8S0SJ14_OLEEU|nr:Hypothetical predicted protein [Olea europaea subsp. europaea]